MPVKRTKTVSGGTKTKTRSRVRKDGTTVTKTKTKGGGTKSKSRSLERKTGGTHVGKGGDYTQTRTNVTTRTKTKNRGKGVTKKKTVGATRVESTEFTPKGTQRRTAMLGGRKTTKTRKGLRKS